MLVVEDNDGVRDYASEVLEELGYRVLAAGNADEALRCLPTSKRIDLLFTDVVLPGAITGRVLADQGHRTCGQACRCSTPRAIRATPSFTRGGSIPTSSY